MSTTKSFFRHIWRPILAAWIIGWVITGSATWGYDSRWLRPHYVIHRALDPRPEDRWFTEEELAVYTGEDPSLPIYLAINGKVFDVSSRPETYGPLGSYRFFSGKDGARAFATGCFETDLTHDLRGLDEAQLEMIDSWQRFFDEHNRYWHVGYVHHDEPQGEPPAPCRSVKKPE